MLKAIRALAVREENPKVARVALSRMMQDRGEPIRASVGRRKSAASPRSAQAVIESPTREKKESWISPFHQARAVPSSTPGMATTPWPSLKKTGISPPLLPHGVGIDTNLPPKDTSLPTLPGMMPSSLQSPENQVH